MRMIRGKAGSGHRPGITEEEGMLVVSGRGHALRTACSRSRWRW